MTPRNIITFISEAAPHFDHMAWISSYISSKNRMYPLTLNLFFKNQAPKRFPRRQLNFVKSVTWVGYELLLQIYGRLLLRRKLLKANSYQNQDKLIIIKTFAYDSSLKDNRFIDPFFKDLIPEFEKQGFQILYIADSLTKWKNLKNLEDTVLPYQLFYSPSEIFKGYFHLLKVSTLFPSLNIKEYMKMGFREKNLSELFYVELLHPQTLINFLFYFSGKRLAKKFPQANSYLYTYENNCWERTFTCGIKEVSPRNKVYAFQHAVMPQASVNMYIGEKEIPYVDYTDIIFTTGKYPNSLFRNLSDLPFKKYRTLGTARFNYLHELKPIESQDFPYEFLIALEGVPQAAEVIERFYKSCSENNSYPKTLLRLHPAFGIEQMQKHLSFDVSKVDFIEVSKSKTVIEDLKKAKLLIYWGSTCALEALKLGKTIIHCKIDSDLDFDPLGGLNDNRFIWTKNTSLFELQRNILNQNENDDGVNKGISFVNDYFKNLQKEELQNYF